MHKSRTTNMLALAPGKLILSGEHAVVYGKPAIAMAVDRFTRTTVSRKPGRDIAFNLIDLNFNISTTLKKLGQLMHRLTDKHRDFVQQKCLVGDILQRPYELAQFVSILAINRFGVILDKGLDISVQSEIPVGCGMGSSAATTVSVLYAIAHFFHLPISHSFLLKLALEAERLQHGYSSGLDLHISYHGGCLYFEKGEAEKRALPDLPMYLVDTGQPTTSTGECVAHARRTFEGSDIAEDFSAVTRSLDHALAHGNFSEILRAINENQALLEAIDVVPEPVRAFCEAVRADGSAAKICGSGAIAGNAGGFALVIGEHPPKKICESFGYRWTPISSNVPGAHIAPGLAA